MAAEVEPAQVFEPSSKPMSKEDKKQIRRAAFKGVGVSLASTTVLLGLSVAGGQGRLLLPSAGLGGVGLLTMPAVFAHRKGVALGYNGGWGPTLGGGVFGGMGGFAAGASLSIGVMMATLAIDPGEPREGDLTSGIFILPGFLGGIVGSTIGSGLLSSSAYTWSAQRHPPLALSFAPTYLPQPGGGVPGLAFSGTF